MVKGGAAIRLAEPRRIRRALRFAGLPLIAGWSLD